MSKIVELKRLSAYLTRQIVAVLIVFTVFGVFAYKLWDVHVAQAAEGLRLYKLRSDIESLKVSYERESATTRIDQERRKLELDKREFIISHSEQDLARSTADIANREQRLAEASAELELARKSVGKEQTIARAEDRIQQLMTEFSSLGVRLNINMYCLKDEELKRYNSALAKFSEITTLVSANHLDEKYAVFIGQNQQITRYFGC